MDSKRNPIGKQGERNIFCAYYGDCLNDAIKQCWEGWNCSACVSRFNSEGRPPERYRVPFSVAYYDVHVKI